MIQYIFLIPEKIGFQWEWINSLIGLSGIVVGAFFGFYLTLLKERHDKKEAIKKEKKEFFEIRNRIPEIVNLVKKGLDDCCIATELYCKTDTNYKNRTTGIIENHEYTMHFGDKKEDIIKEFYEFFSEFKIHLLTYRLAIKETENGGVILSRRFLNQIRKWGDK